VGFVHGNEVHVAALGGETRGQAVQLTAGGEAAGATHGLADFLAQEEMDRYEGFWLSGDGAHCVFEEVTEAHIPVFRINHQVSHIRTPPARVRVDSLSNLCCSPSSNHDHQGEDILQPDFSTSSEDHHYPFTGAPNPKVLLVLRLVLLLVRLGLLPASALLRHPCRPYCPYQCAPAVLA